MSKETWQKLQDRMDFLEQNQLSESLPAITAPPTKLPPAVDVVPDETSSVAQGPVQPMNLFSHRLSRTFTTSAELYNIYRQIVEYLDMRHGATEYAHYISGEISILSFDRCLTVWLDKLPLNLQYTNQHLETGLPPKTATTARHLRLEYLRVRLSLLRPILTRFIIAQPPPNTPIDPDKRPCGENLDYRIALQCCLLCVKTARELVSLTEAVRMSGGKVTGTLRKKASQELTH
jgi:hypothetical protein